MSSEALDNGSVPALCFSLDVERDYRLDGKVTTRGIHEGLPRFVDLMNEHGVPFDLFISGEIADLIPQDLRTGRAHRIALGCHGLTHPAGLGAYLNRKSLGRQANEIRQATEKIRALAGYSPVHFRAPYFSADSSTLRALESQGYLVDSSVLPGRWVRKWKVFPVLDHRGAPISPYRPSLERISQVGMSRVLEVPVCANPLERGSPIGLGFLNAHGAKETVRLAEMVESRYLVFLCHSWELVDWGRSDPVASWVRSACSSDFRQLEALLQGLVGHQFVNMDGILEREIYELPEASVPAPDPSR